MPAVDWDEIDKQLPIACTPGGQAARKEMFDKLDPNHNGLLTFTEVQSGLGSKFSHFFKGRNMHPSLKMAFDVAREINEVKGSKKAVKKADSQVDRSEFHGLLVAFRYFLELDVIFDKIDKDGDRMLCWKEVEKALDKLEDWNVDRAAIKRKFTSDEWAETMKYEDFAELCVAKKCGGLKLEVDQNDAFETLLEDMGGKTDAGALLNAFAKWDVDGNGSITDDELTKVLQELDPSFTMEDAKELFVAADCNNDGKIDYCEFAKWIAKE